MSVFRKYLIGEWNWKRPIKSICFIYCSLTLILYLFSNRLIYQPPPAQTGTQASHLHTQPFTIKNAKGQSIGVYYLPASRDKPTLLWSHGNAESLDYLLERLESFHDRGFGILAYDYPGYGLSGGKPSEQGCYDACQTSWEYLTKTLNVPPSKIIIYGQSIGSGPACWLASHHTCAGLMLVSPFTSVFRTVTHIPLFLGDQFPNIKRISNIHTPLLIIHGKNDKIVPVSHGKSLYKRHPGPKRLELMDHVGHNDIYLKEGDKIIDILEDWSTSLQNHSKQ